MCVILFAYNVHPEFPLILLANRDEYYDRPTRPAHNWDDSPHIRAGRDLVGGGTWLGVTKTGRFAAVTNYRDPSAPTGTLSRGRLASDFLGSSDDAENYLTGIRHASSEYSGFNLLVGEIGADRTELFYFSNRGGDIKKLESGIYGLSNHFLDTPWPKVKKGKAILTENIGQGFSKEACFELLTDSALAEDADLPDTGIGYEREKQISSIFIQTPGYGTRGSTVLTFDNDFRSDLEERVFV